MFANAAYYKVASSNRTSTLCRASIANNLCRAAHARCCHLICMRIGAAFQGPVCCRLLVEETRLWYDLFVRHVPQQDLLLIDHADLHQNFELVVRQLNSFLGLCLQENKVMKVRAGQLIRRKAQCSCCQKSAGAGVALKLTIESNWRCKSVLGNPGGLC